MTIENCQSCENHIVYRNGYVLCNFYKVQEQRMTERTPANMPRVVNCPKKVDARK